MRFFNDLSNVTQGERETIEACLDGFDFKRTHEIMRKSEWTWYHDSEVDGRNLRVPSPEQIEKTARELLVKCVSSRSNVSTGGLFARIENDTLILEFVFDWSSAALLNR